MSNKMKLAKQNGPNTWQVTNDDETRVYGQAVREDGAGPWFMPARGYMVQRSEELEAIAVLLRTAPELRCRLIPPMRRR